MTSQRARFYRKESNWLVRARRLPYCPDDRWWRSGWRHGGGYLPNQIPESSSLLLLVRTLGVSDLGVSCMMLRYVYLKLIYSGCATSAWR